MHGGVLNGGADGGRIFNRGGQALYGEIASRLNKASALATTAQTLNSQGLAEHGFETLMDIEPLIFEATALLNAASIVNRSDTGKENSS